MIVQITRCLMQDIFISYSRKDTDFVKRLHASLKTRGVEAWIDWQDIPPSAEWMTEINDAIDQGNAFIFVLSPDSLTSQICMDEVERAISSGKRIIPLVCRSIDRMAVPPAISKWNYVFFHNNPETEYENNLSRLVEAIETDLDYVKEHSRLLLQAREWERNDRHPSYLLKGKRVKSARIWLDQSKDLTPPPSWLHRVFIQTSITHHLNRRNTIVTLFFMLLIAGGGLWIYLSYTAEQSRQRQAELERRQQAASELLKFISFDLIGTVDDLETRQQLNQNLSTGLGPFYDRIGVDRLSVMELGVNTLIQEAELAEEAKDIHRAANAYATAASIARELSDAGRGKVNSSDPYLAYTLKDLDIWRDKYSSYLSKASALQGRIIGEEMSKIRNDIPKITPEYLERMNQLIPKAPPNSFPTKEMRNEWEEFKKSQKNPKK